MTEYRDFFELYLEKVKEHILLDRPTIDEPEQVKAVSFTFHGAWLN